VTDTESTTHAPTDGPLAGLTVLDLTRVLSGPYCSMMLGDMGARVIKVEQPGRGDDTRGWGPPFQNGESAYFLSINRNKESVTLNFKKPEGRKVLDALIARADVLVENFRPGTLARQGLAYDDLAAAHPGLVYCSVSGFGQTGPRRSEPGYDAVLQAEGGLMSITGPPNGSPYRLGVAIADIVSGMFAAYGVAMALLVQARTGRGQFVDVAMLDSVAAILTYQAGICFATGQAPPRLGNQHPTIVPYETFSAADGDVVVAAGNDTLFRKFCDVLEMPALAEDPRFATNQGRVEHQDTLRPLLAERVRTRSRQQWLDRLKQAGVPSGAVRDLAEMLSDPQLVDRMMVLPMTHPKAGPMQVLGVPVKMGDTPGSVRTPPPVLGQHTHAVLGELGYDADQIAALERAEAI
jgi:crotonobetainyl-CoA:carnitine CoA-transferase CaiB-like acyl-CoA transferase